MNTKLIGRSMRAVLLGALLLGIAPEGRAQSAASGNPCVICGFLEDARKAPVDMAKLHDEAVRRIEGPQSGEVGLLAGNGRADDSRPGTCHHPKSKLPEITGISAALLFLAAMGLHVLYRRVVSGRPRKSRGDLFS